MTPDTAGQCCWGGQVWSKLQNRCVGVPACPAGHQAQGETCVIACPAGQLVTADTSGHCCWPNQGWSSSRNVCVGIAACPAGMMASEETCVTAAAPPPPIAPVQPAPPQYTAPPQPYAQPQQPYAQQPYAQPPQPSAQPQQPYAPQPYAQPPQPYYQPDAPTAAGDRATQRAKLQAKLVDLRQRHAAIGFGGPIVALVLGVPAVPLGIWMIAANIDSSRTFGWAIVGILVTAVGGAMDIIALIEIPSKARNKGALSKQIRATEDELRTLDARAHLFPQMPVPQGLLLALSSPVFTF